MQPDKYNKGAMHKGAMQSVNQSLVWHCTCYVHVCMYLEVEDEIQYHSHVVEPSAVCHYNVTRT
jgi:hypothetical protein